MPLTFHHKQLPNGLDIVAEVNPDSHSFAAGLFVKTGSRDEDSSINGVSHFLEPKHFFEPIHQRIFELASELIRGGKLGTPVTLKTFLPADLDIAGLTVNQYLARLAAEATTIINAEDYGPHHL